MTVIKAELGVQATLKDRELFDKLHPLATQLIHTVGQKHDIKRIPQVGVLVSEASLIREVFMDKEHYSKAGKGASTSFWNPILGSTGLLNMTGVEHLGLKRSLASTFNAKNVEKFTRSIIIPALEDMKTRLKAGEPVDIVEVVSEFVYTALWQLIGFPKTLLEGVDLPEEIKKLRSVTHGVNLAKKSLSNSQVAKAYSRLQFVEDLTYTTLLVGQENLMEGTVLHAMKHADYTDSQCVSLVKALMITGTETVISFIPRMTALFVSTGYLNTEHAQNSLAEGIEEALRVTVPTPIAVRSVIKDTVLGGVSLTAGERVILNTLDACGKLGPFNPGQALPREMKGLWFGAGIHMCIGLPLALQEAHMFAEALLEVQQTHPIQTMLTSREKQGHTGCYRKVILTCKTS